MANGFSKEEMVAFEDMLDGFNDLLVISKNVTTYGTNGQLMERANDTIWRPMPYIMSSQDRVIGTDITFQDVTQLSVPSTIGFQKSVPWRMDANELRDALQEGRLKDSAYQRLASDVNTAVRDVVSLEGTLVNTVSTAATGYDDIAGCESQMNELGIMSEDRYIALSTRDYNAMAGDLAGRANMQTGKTATAYEKSYIGPVAGFETFKMDAGKRVAGAGGSGVTIATNGAQARYVPQSTSTSVGGQINVDNRYQTVTVSSTSNVAVGDCFTIAGVESVHMITKEPTGQAKTFRVSEVVNGTTLKISPPIIGATSSPTDAELAYKNVEVVAPSATAAITFLNTTTAAANPFWRKDSIEILPARYAVPTDQGVGVVRGTTDNGLEVVMTKFFNNKTFVSEYTLDVRFGVVNVQPEMNGILLFNQA